MPRRGGIVSNIGRSAAANRATGATYAGNAPHRAGERAASADDDCSASDRASGAAVATSAVVGMRSAAKRSPCVSRLKILHQRLPASGAADARTADTRKPGANSRVTAAPPTCSAASSTSTERPAASQVGRAHQPVVTAADHDAVVARRTRRSSLRLAPGRAESRRAALQPGAPITPPPGCVLEPHMYIPAHRRPVLRIPRDRAVEQQLIERQLALEDIAFREPDLVLDIPGRADLRMQDEVLEVRAVRARSCR